MGSLEKQQDTEMQNFLSIEQDNALQGCHSLQYSYQQQMAEPGGAREGGQTARVSNSNGYAEPGQDGRASKSVVRQFDGELEEVSRVRHTRQDCMGKC